jgi:hypothetical protein
MQHVRGWVDDPLVDYQRKTTGSPVRWHAVIECVRRNITDDDSSCVFTVVSAEVTKVKLASFAVIPVDPDMIRRIISSTEPTIKRCLYISVDVLVREYLVLGMVQNFGILRCAET